MFPVAEDIMVSMDSASRPSVNAAGSASGGMTTELFGIVRTPVASPVWISTSVFMPGLSNRARLSSRTMSGNNVALR